MPHTEQVATTRLDRPAPPRLELGLKWPPMSLRLEWTVIGTLTIFAIFGFGLRLSKLNAIGFAEDEMNKLVAVRAYEQGDIVMNAEHPMMMKGLIYLSLQTAGLWEDGLGRAVSDEVAVRLPNIIIGALTIIPLFLLTAALFDRFTGLLAAGFWAFGVNAIAVNRIGKEDSLLVFFMLFASYFYLRAKQLDPNKITVKHRHYMLSGIFFGLMIASKYFPHYLGLNALYHHLMPVNRVEQGEPSDRTPKIFYILIVLTFLVANPAILLPPVWEYLNAYMGEKMLVHTGYLFGNQLYRNSMSSTPFGGTPFYFYTLFLAIKIPLIVLIAFVIGLVISIRRWRHAGHCFALFMFLLWIVPYSLIGAKWMRYTLSLMPWVYILAAVGVVEIIVICKARMLHSTFFRPIVPAGLPSAMILLFIVAPACLAYSASPHYSLYTNVLGEGKAGYFFPHDEFYDDGLREALRYVTATAPAGVTIAHETPGVASYYLARFGRNDLKSEVISSPRFKPTDHIEGLYVIVQNGRTYFENREKLAFIRSSFVKAHEVRINGLIAAEVFVNGK